MTDDQRTRRRRRLLVLGLLPLLVALGFAAKVGSMLVLDQDGRASYVQGHYDDALGSFAANTTLNVLETWVAPYDEGTARYRGEDFDGAVAALQAALRDVPATQECRVRINLALAHEAVGDAARTGGQLTRARTAWQTAITVLAEGGCLSAPTHGADARAVDTRLRDKLAQTRDEARAAEDAEQQSRLDRRNELGEEQRDQTEQRQEDEQDQSDGPSPSQEPTANPSGSPTGEPPPVYEW